MEKLLALMSICFVAAQTSSCGYYDNTRQRLVDAGGISSSGNKPRDDEGDEDQTGKGEESPSASPDSQGDTGGAMVPQDCSEGEATKLKGKLFHADGAANAPASDCTKDNTTGRIDCATSLSFVSKKEVEIKYADVTADDGGGRTARHAWAGCGVALEVYLETKVGVFEAHRFTLTDDGKTLSHVATGRTFVREEKP